ncbi:exosome complex component RRP43-like [Eriocheir sinensis]|uniref:exosome complex component RRP43-like n=1 Tax=Eriocheir sinensis TaxID=95602 RepID=UPI0021C72417|nr:exosome complex component RRP43-like [Eriocheir sinensis]XP_050735268.1 exosome complex component RRP43-like [Eriocheir sinensis]
MTSLQVWRTFEPDSYYKTFLEHNKRPDGRGLAKFRAINIKVGTITTAEGSATVRLGHTTVMCGIKAEIATPTLRHPDEGFLVPNVELYPCCSPMFKAGPPGEKAIALSQFLKSVLTSAEVLSPSDLCIASNKLAWCLYCDVICLNYDGNMYDAALIAIMAALQNVKLPEVSYDEESERTTISPDKTLPLKLKRKPVSATFTMYSGSIQLVDPTAEDEEQGNGEVTVVLLEDGSLCTIHKPGGHYIVPDSLDRFIDLAKKRVTLVNTAIDKALAERNAMS